jgi:hypothetical protein
MKSGLPDSIFSHQKFQFGHILEGHGIGKWMAIFNIPITAIWHIMDIWYLSYNLVCFPPFWYIVSRKIWQPCMKWEIAKWREQNLFYSNFFVSFGEKTKSVFARNWSSRKQLLNMPVHTRVTRLGEFSPIGRLFLCLGQLFENLRSSPNIWASCFCGKNLHMY